MTVNTNKEVIAAANTNTAAEVVQAPAAISKAQKANGIFKEMFALPQVPARKDMIKRAMSEAGLTEKGAATYLQNYKSKNGLVKKVAATA